MRSALPLGIAKNFMICLEAVYPAIADEDAFLVILVDDLVILAPDARIGIEGVGTTLVEGSIPREGELA